MKRRSISIVGAFALVSLLLVPRAKATTITTQSISPIAEQIWLPDGGTCSLEASVQSATSAFLGFQFLDQAEVSAAIKPAKSPGAFVITLEAITKVGSGLSGVVPYTAQTSWPANSNYPQIYGYVNSGVLQTQTSSSPTFNTGYSMIELLTNSTVLTSGSLSQQVEINPQTNQEYLLINAVVTGYYTDSNTVVPTYSINSLPVIDPSVPEPSSLLLFISIGGLVLLGRMARTSR
ncbi:MAG: PEP-CTERM sorting domain-containing protein [Acidimicrobiaceae bacterium]|nr:PEP-CTERM sorting domain-containing protein [Acidimicrobiaceae bacterium]